VPTGGAAFFNNSLVIQNIVSRVTGSSASTIDGLIQANGSANLFLINSNGVAFGPNASLNLGGSFLASTANALNFADGSQFATQPTETTALLTIYAPTGLSFTGNSAPINVQGQGHNLTSQNAIFSPIARQGPTSGLQVRPGQTLGLVGGDVSLDGASLVARGGQIAIGAVERGQVRFVLPSSGLVLDYKGVSAFQDILLQRQALADVSGLRTGGIQFNGRDISFKDGSVALLQNFSPLPGGAITVDAARLVGMDGSSADGIIPSGILSEALREGNGANVSVSGQDVTVQNGAVVTARTFGPAQSGNVSISAPGSVNVLGFSRLNPVNFSVILTQTNGSGRGGDVAVRTDQLRLASGGEIGTVTFGAGNGGDALFEAETIELTGVSPASIRTSLFANSSGQGNAGKLTARTSTLTLRQGAVISSSTAAFGNANSVTIDASDSVTIEGQSSAFPLTLSTIFSAAVAETEFYRQLFNLPEVATGNAGTVAINTPRLHVKDGGRIATSATGPGRGGNLTVNAADSVLVEGQSTEGIPSNLSAQTRGIEDAGTLAVNTDRLIVRDGGALTVGTAGGGQGGDLFVNASDSVLLDNDGAIVGNALSSKGGNISITAPSVELLRGSSISTSAAAGEGGNIELKFDTLLLLRDGSSITASAFDNGGNIVIDPDNVVLLSGSRISANSQQGTGGRVSITTQGLFVSPDSAITATSERGPEFNGIVELNTPNQDFARAATPPAPPPQPLEVSSVCQGRPGAEAGQLIKAGTGGIPRSPDDLLNKHSGWREQPSAAAVQAAVLDNPADPEVQGWIIYPDRTMQFITEPGVFYSTTATLPCRSTTAKD